MSDEELRARLQPLVDAGVNLESVTTPALAHASLVRQRRALLPDAVVAVLSVNAQATAITVVHGGVVLFARELPWGDQTGIARTASRRAAGPRRVCRRASRPSCGVRWCTCGRASRVDVSRVLVCGDLFDLRTLTAPLVHELALDVETLDVDDDLDLAKLPEPSDAFRSRLGAWRTALALAADAAPQPGLRRQDERRPAVSPVLLSRVAAAAVVGVLVVAAGWGVLGYLHAGVTARQERLRRTIGVLEPELQRREDERRRAAVATARAGRAGRVRLAGTAPGAGPGSVQPRGAARGGTVGGPRRAGRRVLAPRGRWPGRRARTPEPPMRRSTGS